MPDKKRIFDVLFALLLFVFTLPVLILLSIVVKITSRGPILYWSDRVGRDNRLFRMPKIRSMRVDTPQVSTDRLNDPEKYLIPIGGFIRRTSLDELPQLFSILCGDLSFVGPRPALFNQDDLIALRTNLGIHRLMPGLTGWAQINGRDDLPVPVKVKFDHEYMLRRSIQFDFRILCITFVKVVRSEGIQH